MRVLLLRCCAVALFVAGMLLPAGNARAWFVSIDGSVSPLSEPLSGRIKIASGIAKGHWQFEGSVSFIPTEAFVLYKGNSGNVVEFSQNYPVFFGAGTRYYVFSRTPLEKRHDLYLGGGGVDFPIVAESSLPGFKISGGYALRIYRKIMMEVGIDYYFYGALTNELFVGGGFKSVF